MDENKPNGRDEIYSEKVKAGKRTYFFDVKSTRSNDFYLTITESKKRFKEDGFTYEKHKIFLYKEDFNKFVEALNNTVNHVKNELLPDVDFSQFDQIHEHRQFDQGHEQNHEHNGEEITSAAAEPAEKTSGTDTDLKWE